MKLYTKISIGLVGGAIAGIGANFIASRTGSSTMIDVIVQVEPLGRAWIRGITAIVIPLVVASLIVGAASLGDLRTLGRIGGKTVGYYMTTTAIAVTIGLVLSNIVRPGSGMGEASQAALLETYGGEAAGRIELANQAPGVIEMLVAMIPSNPIGAAASGDMLPLIVFTLVFGAAAAMLAEAQKKILVGFFDAVNHVSMTIIRIKAVTGEKYSLKLKSFEIVRKTL